MDGLRVLGPNPDGRQLLRVLMDVGRMRKDLQFLGQGEFPTAT